MDNIRPGFKSAKSNKSRSVKTKTIARHLLAKLILLMVLLCQNTSYATVTLAENEDSSAKKQIVKVKVKEMEKRNLLKKPDKNEQYDIEGYAESKYVRFVVEITNNNLVTGQMKQRDGTNRYVNGELIKGVLHLYDLKGKYFTVVLPKKYW